MNINENGSKPTEKKKKKLSRFFGTVFLLVLFAATAIYILTEFDIKTLYGTISASEHKTILVFAPLLMIVFFVCFALFIRISCKALDIKMPLFRPLTYSFLDFFYTSATPAGCGSPAGTAFAMARDGIPASDASAITIMYVICFRFALLIYGAVSAVLLFTGSFGEDGIFRILFIAGAIISTLLAFAFFAMLFFTRMTRACVLFLIRLGAKLHIIRDKSKAEEKFGASLEEYKAASVIIRSDKKLLLKLIIITLIQRGAYFAISFVVYKSFGLSANGFLYIFFLQVAVAISADNLPLPGGIGVNEYIFYILYESIYPASEQAAAAMIMTRAFCYYIPFLCTAIVAFLKELIYNIRYGRKEKT